MPDKLFSQETIVLLMISAMSGAFGGGAVVAYNLLQRKALVFALVAAHLFIGAVAGVMWYLWSLFESVHPVNKIIIECFMAGGICSAVVASTTFSAGLFLKYWLERKGMTLEINVTQAPEKK